MDATDKAIALASGCKFKDVRVIMLDGLGFAGLNLVDIKQVHRETSLPAIAVVRKKPDFEDIDNALKNLSEIDYRRNCIKAAGNPLRV